VALEAIKGENTIVEIGSKYGLHPNQIGQWRKEVLNRLPKFTKGRQKKLIN
jgi:transposase-like protein